MNRNLRALLLSLIATGAGTVLFFIPVINVFAFIVVMLPLGVVDSIGIIDVGEPRNGFFVPNTLGYVIAGISHWLLCFALIRTVLPRNPLRRSP
jgi:hypothetical protein